MSTPLDRLTTALSDRYRLERELGQGGMATVYLAEDLKHKRQVAIKVLKPELAAVLGAERFVQEITTTAALQHPHILPLFDSGEADGFLYYVMPFIDGETLRGKLDRETQLGIEESVRIASDVASALHYAHEHGVIHRDIKPENILLHDGRPMVADFGIALAVSAAAGGRMTETGLSLGTPHYMSPEQATAEKEISARSDVYSLGSVLYEMLTGEPPHMGNSAQQIIMKIVTEEAAPVTRLRKAVPPNVAAAVAKALEKLPADRFASAKAFTDALTNPAFVSSSVVVTGRAGTSARGWNLVSVVSTAVAAVALFGAALWVGFGPDRLSRRVVRASIDLGDIQLVMTGDQIVISPDGSTLAATGVVGETRGLWVRRLDEDRFRLLIDHGGPSYPDFSPDGNWIVYRAHEESSLRKVALADGVARDVIPSSAGLNPGFPDWGDGGTIVFRANDGIYRVADTGGTPLLIADSRFIGPHVLPGGGHVLLTDLERGSVAHLSLDTDSIVELVPGALDARYVGNGTLLYADPGGRLWAARLDARGPVIVGEPVPVADNVHVVANVRARFSASANGHLVYTRSDAPGQDGEELLRVSLGGRVSPLPLRDDSFRHPRWSPTGASVVYVRGGAPGGRLVLSDVEVGTVPRELTSGSDADPVWSRDGRRIAFSSSRSGTAGADLFAVSVDGDGPPIHLLARGEHQIPLDWAEDNTLLFQETSGTNLSLHTLPTAGSGVPTRYLASPNIPFSNQASRSPDGNWIVYQAGPSQERDRSSDSSQIQVRSFPSPGPPIIVAERRVSAPRWSPDGTRIYYWRAHPSDLDSLFVVQVGRSPFPEVLSAETLILVGDFEAQEWDLHPQGDQFVVPRQIRRRNAAKEERARHSLVLNWREDVQAIRR